MPSEGNPSKATTPNQSNVQSSALEKDCTVAGGSTSSAASSSAAASTPASGFAAATAVASAAVERRVFGRRLP